jgi:hypothetical protein
MICDCAAPSEPLDPADTLSAGQIIDLFDEIAHLAGCSHFTEPQVGQRKFCGPGGRPGAAREVES